MSKPITSSTASSLSTTPSTASALSTTAVPASTTAVTATIFASASSLSTPSSASASSTTSSASTSSTTAAASASLQSGPGLQTIVSILKSLNVPENFWETHILGVKLYFNNRTNLKNYSNVIKLQAACVAQTYNSPYAIETLIKRLDAIIPESERELFLKNLSKGPEEEKGSK